MAFWIVMGSPAIINFVIPTFSLPAFFVGMLPLITDGEFGTKRLYLGKVINNPLHIINFTE